MSSSATGRASLKRYSSRPFPPYRHEPGKTPHPERDPGGHSYTPEPETQSRDDDYFFGIDLFNAEYWWEAHVCWERLWAESPAPDAMDFLQGLIQLSAALVKRREGNRDGEAKLLAKAIEKLRNAREHGGTFMGVRLEPLIADVESGVTPRITLHV